MIKIYGSPMSSSGRCFWCLEEVGQEYEAQAIDFKKGEHKSPDFLKINPNGKLPALIDGDFTIWESMAINFYLAKAYKPELLGKNDQENGIVHQWSIWSVADLQAPIIAAFIELVFVPEDKRDQNKIAQAIEKAKPLLETLNQNLEGKDYIIGEDFSLADINVASVVAICEHIQLDLSSYTSINKWMNRLSERPSFIKYQSLIKK